MKYQGKRRLYQFLSAHGYEVPKLKYMEYEFFRGSEWLKDYAHTIELYCNGIRRDGYANIYVMTYEENEDGEVKEYERIHFVGDTEVYRTIRGRVELSRGKKL